MSCRPGSNPLGLVFPVWSTVAFRVSPDTSPPPLSLLAHPHILSHTYAWAHRHTHPHAPFDGASLARTWQPRPFLVTSVESHSTELRKEFNVNEVPRESGLFHFTTLWMKRGKYDSWDVNWIRYSKTNCERVRWASEPETEENETVRLEQTLNQANHQMFPNEAVHQAC